jgi:uncharacterized protein YecE (DUF72 family)
MTLDATRDSKIKIGTCGYSYPGSAPKGWYGVFYPPKRGRGFDELEYYARFFDVVEINSTFYRAPAPAMANAWAAKTPEHFAFAVKVWQKFTHARKIGADPGAGQTWEKPTDDDVREFKSGIAPLVAAKKLALLLFQYPAGFHHSEENLERLRWNLAAFSGYEKVVELRHRSWSLRQQEVQTLLAESGASWAIIDEPKFLDSVRQDFALAGDIFYLRMHGRNQQKWWSHAEPWERYDYLYTPQQIGTVKETVGQQAKRAAARGIYVFFNNHARGQAVANALMLKRELGQDIPLLPQHLVQSYPQLAPLPAEPRGTLL